MSNREEERKRLLQETLNRKQDRPDKKEVADVELHLHETPAPESSSASTRERLLRSADSAFSSLREILSRQQKDLQELSKENGLDEESMVRMQAEIEKDYGVAPEVKSEPPDVDRAFAAVQQRVQQEMVGQNEAVKALCSAYRRPYVMGSQGGGVRNVILVNGPKGSGRHYGLRAVCKAMHEEGLLPAAEVACIDLSRYTSQAQEQVFLQDIYEALSSAGKTICLENFESGFAPFLRMLSDLIMTGTMPLNKRYVLSKGMLVEAQTGLVKDAVNALNADGFYLVLLTSRGIGAVQDAFGAQVVRHILDTVSFHALQTEEAAVLTENAVKSLRTQVKERLKMDVTVEPEVISWIVENYDKSQGVNAIEDMLRDFYISLSEIAMQNNGEIKGTVLLDEKQPAVRIGEETHPLLRAKMSQEEIAAVDRELDAIIGLKPVKSYIRSLQAHIEMNRLRRSKGLAASEVARHMIFTGNPGTGKTTVARLVARYMKAIGALSQGQLVEVSRKDLVAQYVGQTAPLTMSVVKSALGGVLFIDEAYSLYRGDNDSFGKEAIDTIVKAMEDYRDDLIVILAGYKKEMGEFLEANSGLRSRFPNTIDFPDYTGAELLAICRLLAEKRGYRLAEDALKPLEEFFTSVQAKYAAEAGNGRLARNELEEAILRQARRVLQNPKASLDELEREDFDYTYTL